MSMKTIILFVILFFVIRFIIRIIVPILRVTKMTHAKMNEMKNAMEQMQQNQGSQKKYQHATATVQNHKIDGEYIDFEEVK